MPIPEDYRDLVVKLLKASEGRRVFWAEPTTATNSFRVTFKNFTITLHRGLDENTEQEWVGVEVRDGAGKRVDWFSCSKSDRDFNVVSNLYDLALRRARKIDQAVQEIAKELESQGQIGYEVEDVDDTIPF